MEVYLAKSDNSSELSQISNLHLSPQKQNSVDLWRFDTNSYIDSDDLFSKWSEDPENVITNERELRLFDIEHATASIINLPAKNRINFSEVRR